MLWYFWSCFFRFIQVFLDWWNTTKSYCNIWHQSLCLCTLWSGLQNNLGNKLNYNDGFLREVQDRTKKCRRICWVGFPILQSNPRNFQPTKFEFWKFLENQMSFTHQQLWITNAGPSQAGAGGVPPLFGRSVNSISTRGGTFSPPSTTSPSGFSDLATALQRTSFF